MKGNEEKGRWGETKETAGKIKGKGRNMEGKEMNGGKENNKLEGDKKREYRAVVGNNWHSVHRATVT